MERKTSDTIRAKADLLGAALDDLLEVISAYKKDENDQTQVDQAAETNNNGEISEDTVRSYFKRHMNSGFSRQRSIKETGKDLSISIEAVEKVINAEKDENERAKQ